MSRRFPWLGVLSLLGLSITARAQPPRATVPTPISMDIMHAQVILDHLGFSPGVIDGREGQSLTLALRGFQEARGLPITGEMDPATLRALAAWRAIRPTRLLVITPEDAAGPFTGPLPRDLVAQAKFPALGYPDLAAKLAEKFHTTPETLAALNGGAFQPAAGAKLRFPNTLPQSRDYPLKLEARWRQALSDLNVDATQPAAARVVVDKSDGALRVYDQDDRLVAQFPATMGSEHDPLPLGGWTIKGTAYLPPFHYNPRLFWDADKRKGGAVLPPGPRGPVGVVWLDISKPHYGIHGTPSPEKIGRTESHGCIRLTNWDAARLSLMVKPGTPALFRE